MSAYDQKKPLEGETAEGTSFESSTLQISGNTQSSSPCNESGHVESNVPLLMNHNFSRINENNTNLHIISNSSTYDQVQNLASLNSLQNMGLNPLQQQQMLFLHALQQHKQQQNQQQQSQIQSQLSHISQQVQVQQTNQQSQIYQQSQQIQSKQNLHVSVNPMIVNKQTINPTVFQSTTLMNNMLSNTKNNNTCTMSQIPRATVGSLSGNINQQFPIHPFLIPALLQVQQSIALSVNNTINNTHIPSNTTNQTSTIPKSDNNGNNSSSSTVINNKPTLNTTIPPTLSALIPPPGQSGIVPGYLNPFFVLPRVAPNPSLYFAFNPSIAAAAAAAAATPTTATPTPTPTTNLQSTIQANTDSHIIDTSNLLGNNPIISQNSQKIESSSTGLLLDDDLEQLHNHAESLVKTLLETSVPKPAIRLRLEWDRRRYCFKFTVYQIEEVRDSLGYQKKRLIPIDQDELFVNVNASKQLSIDNIEKAMWSAFVSVRHALAKYCDRQAGQRKQTNTSSNSTRANGSNIAMRSDEDQIFNGQIKGYKKEEYGYDGSRLNTISSSINTGISSRSYKTSESETSGTGRGKRSGSTTTTRSGRFVALRYGYDDILLSDDDMAECEYGRKGRGRNSVKYIVSSSGEEDTTGGLNNVSVSNTGNRYAKTYITSHRGRRANNNNLSNSTNIGGYRTRGSLLESYRHEPIVTTGSSNTPIFVLEKDTPGKDHSLVGLYAEWVDKMTQWDVRKGPLKTVFVTDNNINNNKNSRGSLRYTTNNYIKWDSSHITNDLRGIHIPLSIAGDYFGLLRKEIPIKRIESQDLNLESCKNIEDSTRSQSEATNNDEITEQSICNENKEKELDSSSVLVKLSPQQELAHKISGLQLITIKTNHIPNINQIRFVSSDNNEDIFNCTNIQSNSLDENNNNNNNIATEAAYMEKKLLEMEVVDPVLVSTIQTTAALEQRRKRENKQSSHILPPTGLFLSPEFPSQHYEDQDEREERECLIDKLESYRNLVLRFMHQQHGDEYIDGQIHQQAATTCTIQETTVDDNSLCEADIGVESSTGIMEDLNENSHGYNETIDYTTTSCNNSSSTNIRKIKYPTRGMKRKVSSRSAISGENPNLDGNSTSNQHSGSSSTENISNQACILNTADNCTNSLGSSISSSGGAIAASAMLEGLITSVRGNANDKYRQQAYPQNRFVSKKKGKDTNEILAKYVNELAHEYCYRNFGSTNLADGYINAFNSHVLKIKSKDNETRNIGSVIS
ncbi:hypothetical protein cand_018220 [Cryptosporidium andersoni]|uniref:Uncharacterized protein n=1 Tax=Cryptosporidium andersoni TaxID=117008 RepID=A0A1J4MJ97_9CRYT|nr:hypothetical protein cand_018220 [Cryptosporidium andersoni]